MEGGGGGGGSVGRAGVVILSLKDWDTPTRPSFVDPAAEKDCRASLREGRDIIRSLVVSWNMIPPLGRRCSDLPSAIIASPPEGAPDTTAPKQRRDYQLGAHISKVLWSYI